MVGAKDPGFRAHECEVRWTEYGQGRFAFVNSLCKCASVYHRRFAISRVDREDLGYIARTTHGAIDAGLAPRRLFVRP